MKINYCAACESTTTPFFWLDVTGDLLPDIAPHLAGVATFAVSRCPIPDRWYKWTVTNLETGRATAHGRTRATVVTQATVNLAMRSPNDFIEAYKRSHSTRHD